MVICTSSLHIIFTITLKLKLTRILIIKQFKYRFTSLTRAGVSLKWLFAYTRQEKNFILCDRSNSKSAYKIHWYSLLSHSRSSFTKRNRLRRCTERSKSNRAHLAHNYYICMQDTFARARTRPSARATIGYLVYNYYTPFPCFNILHTIIISLWYPGAQQQFCLVYILI